MMADRRTLRTTLSAVTQLCSALHHNPQNKEVLKEIRRLLSNVTAQMLEISLPDPNPDRSGFYGSLYTADIHENSIVSCSVFGMKKLGDKVPLHDHRNSFGFIKVLRGALRIRSFSFLENQEELKEYERAKKEGGFNVLDGIPTRFEGEQDYQASSPGDPVSLACLDQMQGNIHEVVALEDGTSFFDVLSPGYSTPTSCIYYDLLQKSTSFVKHDVVWLRSVPVPRSYFTEPIWYNSIVQL